MKQPSKETKPAHASEPSKTSELMGIKDEERREDGGSGKCEGFFSFSFPDSKE